MTGLNPLTLPVRSPLHTTVHLNSKAFNIHIIFVYSVLIAQPANCHLKDQGCNMPKFPAHHAVM